MNKTDWKIRGTVVLLILLVIFVVAQFMAKAQYRYLLTEELDDITQTITSYVDTCIENANKTMESFVVVKDNQMLDENNVSLYIGEWVENTDGIVAMFFIENDNVYSYSISSEFDNINTLKEFIDKAYSSGNGLIEVDANKKVVYISKKIYNNYESLGLLVGVYDLTDIFDTIRKSGLNLNYINVYLKDIYNNVLYTNVTNTTNNDEKELPTKITGLGESKDENLIKKAWIDVDDFFTRMFSTGTANVISKKQTCSLDVIVVETNCNINEASYHFQTREVISVAILCILIFIIVINSTFVKTDFSKVRIYILSFLAIEVVLTIYFAIEFVYINKVEEKGSSIEGYFINETINIEDSNTKSKANLLVDILRNIAKYSDLENHATKIKYNEIVYSINTNSSNVERMIILNNDKIIFEYPNISNEVETNFKTYLQSNQDIFYDNESKMMFFSLNKDNYTFCFEYKIAEFENTTNEDYVKEYEFKNKNEEENLDLVIENLLQKSSIKEINYEVKFIKTYNSDYITNYILLYNEDNEVYKIYVITEHNHYINLVYIYIGSFLLILLATFLLYFYRRNIDKKSERKDKKSKNDMIMLDRLLNKINEDIESVNKSSDEFENQLDTDKTNYDDIF